MSWKIALTVALLTAVITALATAPVADHVTSKLRVSNMEGQRGMAIAFIFIPAGFLGGFLLGLLGTKLVHAVEWAQFWKAAGVSLAMSLGGLVAIAGLSLLGSPITPQFGGKPLELQAEILIPRPLQPKAPIGDGNPRASLYAGPSDNHRAEVDTGRIRTDGDTLVVPITASLNTACSPRMLSIIIDDSLSYTLDMPLQPSPQEGDFQWTAPLDMRLSVLNGKPPAPTGITARYRVAVADSVQ